MQFLYPILCNNCALSATRAFEPLLEQLMLLRSSDILSHLVETGERRREEGEDGYRYTPVGGEVV